MAVSAIPLLELVWKMFDGLLKGYIQQKKDLFENHVEPVQKRIETIHKDYLAGFQEVRHHLKDGKAPPSDLLEFLRERRREYDYERQSTKDLAAELKKIDNIFLSDAQVDALEAYAEAITDYFKASTYIGSVSWYTDFIDMVETNVKVKNKDAWRAVGIAGTPPRKELLRRVDWILDKGLPEAAQKVSAAYAKLKRLLL